MHFDLYFGIFWKLLVFIEIDEVFAKFLGWVLLKWVLKRHALHHTCIITIFPCIIDVCYVRFGLGWAHDNFFGLHVTCSCVRTFISLYSYILMCLVLFCVSLFLPLSFFRLVASWHQRNPLRPRTLFILGNLLLLTLHLLMYSSMMIKPERTFQRTFVDEAFIRNAKSSYQIFLILNYPLSFTVGVGSQYVTSRSLVPLWSYRSFTPICTE